MAYMDWFAKHLTPDLTKNENNKQITNNNKGNLIMSLTKQDVRLKVSPDIHKMIEIIAASQDKTITEVGSLILEKFTIAEFHELRVTARRIERAGLIRDD